MQNNSTPPQQSDGPSTVWEKLENLLSQCRDSRRLVLVIVAIGLLLDNMLLTSVGMFFFKSIFTRKLTQSSFLCSSLVPIIPAFLYELNHEKDLAKLNESLTSITTTITPVNGKLSQIDQTFLQQSQLLNRLLAPNSPLAKKLNPYCEKEVCVYIILN